MKNLACKIAACIDSIKEILSKPLDVNIVDQPPEYDVEVTTVCNSETGFFDETVITFKDGVEDSRVTNPTTVKCVVEDPPVVTNEVEFVCNSDTEFFDEINITFIDGVEDDRTVTATSIPCIKEDPPVVSVDVEFVCNEATGFYDQITITTTDGVPAAPVTAATTIVCDDEPPVVSVDVEFVCNEATGFYDQVSVTTTDGVQSPPVITATSIVCDDEPPVVQVDNEFVCNLDTGFFDQITITTTDGIPGAPVVTGTTIICDEEKIDFEQVEYCDNSTETIHILTQSIGEDGTVTTILDTDTGVECGQPDPQIECVESQEWTYGIDNTGTSFNWADAEYEITLSDGSTLTYNQTAASNGGWTAQMVEWGNSIQAAADNAGLKWLVETRFIVGPDGSSLAGGGGLLGPPSAPVGQALYSGGMRWRYINIQICPGQPVPVSADLVAVDDPNGATVPALPRGLTTAGAVLGPIQKFMVCRTCGEEPVWYLEDGVTEAPQIPFCWEPCGTLALTDSPPDRACDFFFDLGCDNNNSEVFSDFTQQITRRAKVCNGEQISLEYFTEDPNDPTALQDYEIQGDFVDCDTGLPLDVPQPPCDEFVSLGNMFQLDGLTGDLLNREWNIGPIQYNNITVAAGQAVIDGFDFTVTPDVQGSWGTLDVNDSNNSNSEQDAQIISGYIVVDKPTMIRYSGASLGYINFLLGKCCGPLETIIEGASGDGTANPTPTAVLPAGIHEVMIWNIDDFVNTSRVFETSIDGGLTWVASDEGISFSQEKPEEVCVPVVECVPSGLLLNALTDELIDPSSLFTCSKQCDNSLVDGIKDLLTNVVVGDTCCRLLDGEKVELKPFSVWSGGEVTDSGYLYPDTMAPVDGEVSWASPYACCPSLDVEAVDDEFYFPATPGEPTIVDVKPNDDSESDEGTVTFNLVDGSESGLVSATSNDDGTFEIVTDMFNCEWSFDYEICIDGVGTGETATASGVNNVDYSLGPNLVGNDDFCLGQAANGQPAGSQFAQGWTASVPSNAPGVYPVDTTVSVINGLFTDNGILNQVPFPGDPVWGVPATDCWLYSNGNNTGGAYISAETTVNLVAGCVYEFSAYTSSVIAPGTIDPSDDSILQFLLDGAPIGPQFVELDHDDPNSPDNGQDVWHRRAFQFTASSSGVSVLQLRNDALGDFGNDVGLTRVEVRKVTDCG